MFAPYKLFNSRLSRKLPPECRCPYLPLSPRERVTPWHCLLLPLLVHTLAFAHAMSFAHPCLLIYFVGPERRGSFRYLE